MIIARKTTRDLNEAQDVNAVELNGIHIAFPLQGGGINDHCTEDHEVRLTDSLIDAAADQARDASTPAHRENRVPARQNPLPARQWGSGHWTNARLRR